MARSDYPWHEPLDFVTRSAGTFRASRRKIFFQAQTHSIRHYAQLATLVRQQGIKTGWVLDLLASPAMD
jgi:uncharacterized damage-inducible protein DinB